MAGSIAVLTSLYSPIPYPYGGGTWAVRLVYRGPNENNKSGTSDKWWQVICRDDIAEINFGKAGSTGRSSPVTKSRSEAIKALRQKVCEGYQFDRSFKPEGGEAPKAPLAHLGDPFDRIVRVRHGLDAKSYAFDAQGGTVCVIPRSEAEALLRQYPDLSP